VTPTMVASIGWKTYLVFAIFNACFIPIIYFYYPETAGRSLEEIDIVFARAYVNGESPVHVARNMPRMNDAEVEAAAAEIELHDRRDAQDVEKSMLPVRGSPELPTELEADTTGIRARALPTVRVTEVDDR
jgi:hypothetical protein